MILLTYREAPMTEHQFSDDVARDAGNMAMTADDYMAELAEIDDALDEAGATRGSHLTRAARIRSMAPRVGYLELPSTKNRPDPQGESVKAQIARHEQESRSTPLFTDADEGAR